MIRSPVLQVSPPWWKRDVWTVANAITAVKIPLAVVFPFFGGEWRVELSLLGIAAISDLTDGWVARRMGQDGGLGMVLDPVCDKLFLLTVVVTFLLDDRLSFSALLIITSRDVYVLFASVLLIASGKAPGFTFQARFFGKAVTALQFLIFVLIVLGKTSGLLLLSLLVLSVLACYDYTSVVLRRPSGAPNP